MKKVFIFVGFIFLGLPLAVIISMGGFIFAFIENIWELWFDRMNK